MKDADKKALFQSYSSKFTDRVTAEYFARAPRVESKDVMSVQSIKQVNLFVVKNLYDSWQRESGKLRSPFFNFQSPKVQAALQTFMNTLSHHVSLDKDTYTELLQKSTEETLSLVFHPYDYYYALLKGYEAESIPISYLEYIAKYIKTNGHILEHMLEVMKEERLESLAKDRVQWLIDQALQRTNEDPVDVDPFITEFSQVIPLHIDDIYGDGPRAWEKEESNEAEEQHPEPQESQPAEEEVFMDPGNETAQNSEDEIDISEPVDAGSTEEVSTDVAEDPNPDAPESREIEFPEPNLHLSDDHKKPGKNLAEALANRVDYSFDTPEKSILNDILSHDQGESLADKHQKTKIESIKKSLSINQRFMFVNALFQGDEQAFERTLEHLESVDNADDATSFLTHKFSHWDIASDEVQEFLLLIHRRFG